MPPRDNPFPEGALLSPEALEEAFRSFRSARWADTTIVDRIDTPWFIDEPPISNPRQVEPMTPAKAKTIKKERHLTKSERTALHHPPKDKFKLVELDCSDIL